MASKRGKKEILTQMHMSLAFFFIFVAYQSLENIQSSLNFEAGLGTISISVVYGSYLISSFLIGSLVVHVLSPKWTLFFSFFCHTIFIIANVFPLWSTMITASFLLGTGSGPYWIAQGTYTTVLAVRYSTVTGEPLSYVAAKFSGIFHVFWGASKPIGNLITSLVLSQDSNQSNCSVSVSNETMNTSAINNNNSSGLCNLSRSLEFCGPNHCPYMEEHQQGLEKPDTTLIYIMIAILLLFNIAGIVSTLFLDNVPATQAESVYKRISSIFSALKEPNLLLLIIPSCLVGIIPGTYYSTFAQSVISCIFGIKMVGYTMVCEGTGFAIASLLCGPLTKYLPRFYHVILALTIFIAFGVWFLFWFPQHFWVVCIVSVVYGSMHGVCRTHVAGLISLLFPHNPEAAFAHYNIWMGVGFSASFAYSNFLCYRLKIYVFLGVTSLAALTYCILEWRIKNRKFKKDEEGKPESKALKSIT